MSLSSSPLTEKEHEPLKPTGLLASMFPVSPAPARIWRRRGMLLLLAVPVEIALTLALSRWLSHEHAPIRLLLAIDEGLAAALLLQSALGLALWRQRTWSWVLLVATVLGLVWLAGWPSPLVGR